MLEPYTEILTLFYHLLFGRGDLRKIPAVLKHCELRRCMPQTVSSIRLPLKNLKIDNKHRYRTRLVPGNSRSNHSKIIIHLLYDIRCKVFLRLLEQLSWENMFYSLLHPFLLISIVFFYFFFFLLNAESSTDKDALIKR